MNDATGRGGRLSPLVYLANNPISLLGVLLATTAGVAWMFTLPAHFSEQEPHPYLALLVVIGLPALLAIGLLLIPLGSLRRRRKERRKGTYPTDFPPLDWRNADFRRLTGFILAATAINVIIGGHLTFAAVEYMDSNTFCGRQCHVMTPEFTAFRHAPHARIKCVDCHIGAGAGSLLEAKLNGLNQLAGVILNRYPRPVPSPVHNLAQGHITCGKCHSRRDYGVKRKVWIHFAEDEANSATRTELNIRIGGGDDPAGAHGAHLSEGVTIEYLSDPERATIPWLRVTDGSGRETVYTTSDWSEEQAGDLLSRTMDCTDCHNRPAHTMEVPGKALDQALAARRIDPSLPWIKKKGLELLTADYENSSAAARRIPAALRAFYQSEHASLAATQGEAIERAADELVALYERNVFPEYSVTWGTHPNHLGHRDYPGCFRCHDGRHGAEDGRVLDQTCVACHDTIAVEEPISAPEALAPILLSKTSALPKEIPFETRLGPVVYDHSLHLMMAGGDCLTCHNKLFPMAKAPLHFGGADLHRTASATGSSCAGCHRADGLAFPAAENCQRCHVALGPEPTAQAAPGDDGVPAKLVFDTALGEVSFDHETHILMAGEDCLRCHTKVFPFSRAPLGYAEDLHQKAEAGKSSCAACHHPGGAAFASADNCGKCHPALAE